jgi:transcription antitermination factor NusA-like protein
MKAPICGVCLKSDILCMACKKKLDEGKITESDVRISRLVSRIGSGPINEVTIKRVIEGENTIVIICAKGDAARLVGKEGIMIKKLSKNAGKMIRVIEETGNIKEFIQNLIYPVPLSGLNIMYRPEGEMLKVLIPSGRNIPLNESSFSEIIKMVFGKHVVVSRQ